MSSALVHEVIEHLEALPPDLQKQVLVFVRSLDSATLQGVSGQTLLQFAGAISLSDLEIMQSTIEQGCEQADGNEW